MSGKRFSGRLLISSARMDDPNFTRSVILLVQGGDDGILGLILNRPMEVTVEEACTQVLDTNCVVQSPLYKGGPCEGPLMVVHDRESASDLEIVGGVYFTQDRTKIEQLLEGGASRAKFFVGYSGWSDGQLAGEVDSGSWINVPADVERIFDTDPEQWTRLITELTAGQAIRREQMPIDPSLN